MPWLKFLSPILPKDRVTSCRGCKACEDVCPTDAIQFKDITQFNVNRKACVKHILTTEDKECWICSSKCPNNVIRMILIDIPLE